MSLEDLSTRQKILIGIALLAIGVLGLYGIYVFFLKAPTPSPAPIAPTTGETAPKRTTPGLPSARTGTPGTPITTPQGTTAETPSGTNVPQALVPVPSPIANGGLTAVTALTALPVVAPARTANGKDLAYYNPEDGKFYRVTPAGTEAPLSDQTFRDVESVRWAPQATKAILEFPDGANVLYDFNAKRQVTLPKHWTDFSFSPSGNEIVFKSIGLDPEDRWLSVAAPDGSGVTAVEPLGKNADKVTVNWSPNQQMLGTYTESRDATHQELFFIGQHGENFHLAVLEGRQFVGQWTPTGDRMLYSVYSPQTNFNPSLWIVDAAPGTSGENRQGFELQTWADKCTILADNTTAYCAVPRNLPQGAGIVREIAKDIPDDFYRLNLGSGTTTLLATPSADVNATNLVTSTDGNYLFFTDTLTGQLKKMQLR